MALGGQEASSYVNLDRGLFLAIYLLMKRPERDLHSCACRTSALQSVVVLKRAVRRVPLSLCIMH